MKIISWLDESDIVVNVTCESDEFVESESCVETWVSPSGPEQKYSYGYTRCTFDRTRNAFIPPQTYPSWILNEQTCLWDAPTPYPADGNAYRWDEATVSWVEIVTPGV